MGSRESRERHHTRRSLLRMLVVCAALQGVSARGRAGPASSLDSNDPQAKRLGYVENASTVDRGANPSFTPEQKCSNCVQYRGRPQEPRGPCNVFEGKTVAAAGWCVVWGQETGELSVGCPGLRLKVHVPTALNLCESGRFFVAFVPRASRTVYKPDDHRAGTKLEPALPQFADNASL